MSESATGTTLDGVRQTLIDVLGLDRRPEDLSRDTGLFGSLPELDSLAVLELLQSLEERFQIVVDDADFDAEAFETVGSLTDFVDARLG